MKHALIYFCILLFSFIFVTRLHGQDFKKFVSRNQAVSKGINFGIRYPSDWQTLDEDRPNVAAKIFSPGNEIGLVITIKKFPEKLNIEDLSPEVLKEMLGILASQEALKTYPGENTFIRGKANIVLDNMVGSYVEFENKSIVLDKIQYSHMVVYTLLYKDCSISINFGAKGSTENSSNKNFDINKDIIDQMILSFTVYNQYE